MENRECLPVIVIGAGPVGLAAAAHLIARGESFILLESGDAPAASVRSWGHVRLFSPWRYLIDPAAVELLNATGWQMPDSEAHPTGHELREMYLLPLAALPEIASALRLDTRVTGVSRAGIDNVKTTRREDAPFIVTTLDADGRENRLYAKAIIDASGTYNDPNPLGAHGLPAAGERAFMDRVFYGIPDITGAHRARYAHRKTLVVGSGHSAFNAILALVRLADDAPETEIIWAIRRESAGQMFGGGAADALQARGQLGSRVEALVESGRIQLVTGVRVEAIRAEVCGCDGNACAPGCCTSDRMIVEADGMTLEAVDEIIATTGFRPDLAMLREVRLALDPMLESPSALASLIDPNVHSCGTVPPHGVEELSHPEKGFYIVGMKSYGRAPTFLMLTGYEQVRSVVAAIAGDWEAAHDVQLVLPETGVCSTDGLEGGACCAPANGLSAGVSNVAFNISPALIPIRMK